MHDDNYDIAVLGLVAIVLWKSFICLIHLYSYFVELNQFSAVVGAHARSGLIKTMDSNYTLQRALSFSICVFIAF